MLAGCIISKMYDLVVLVTYAQMLWIKSEGILARTLT